MLSPRRAVASRTSMPSSPLPSARLARSSVCAEKAFTRMPSPNPVVGLAAEQQRVVQDPVADDRVVAPADDDAALGPALHVVVRDPSVVPDELDARGVAGVAVGLGELVPDQADAVAGDLDRCEEGAVGAGVGDHEPVRVERPDRLAAAENVAPTDLVARPPSIVIVRPATLALMSRNRLRLAFSLANALPTHDAAVANSSRRRSRPCCRSRAALPRRPRSRRSYSCPARLMSTPSAPTMKPGSCGQKRSPVSLTSLVTTSPQPALWVVKLRSSPHPGPPCCCESWAQRRKW